MQVLFRYRVDSHQGVQAFGQNDTGVEGVTAKVERGPDNQERPEIHRHPKEAYQEYTARQLCNFLR